jgi:GTPase
MFIDRVKVKVKGGDGGRGCVSFRREKFVPKGGPDGGDGGDGGHVIFRVAGGETTLVGLHGKPYYEAGRGMHGEGKDKSGARGSNVVCLVPPGTVVRDEETGEVLCDLTGPGEEFIVARGGKGGKGNARFKTPQRRAPKFAQPGQPGEQRQLFVELKIIAQVGLVGFPNAGKSTLIRCLTAAHAKIGEYPFTTLSPVIGTLQLSDLERIIIADIPGLIEGAHTGAGLGHDFLRHIERTRLLVFVVDVSDTAQPPAEEALKILRSELGKYREELLERPWILALDKIDLLDEEQLRLLDERLPLILEEAGVEKAPPVCRVSGQVETGREELIEAIRKVYREVTVEEEGI